MEPTDRLTGMQAAFKKCNNCGFEWESRNRFMGDPDLDVIGYQANFKKLLTGLLYFNHSCGSTLAVPAYYFVDLYHGPVFETRATGSDCCPDYCLRKEELRPCPAKCECAYIREVIQSIKEWPKT